MDANHATSSVSGRVGSGFWARQTPKDRVALIAFGTQVVVSVALLWIGISVEEATLDLGKRLALVTGNIIVLVLALQFAMSRFFDDQTEHIDRVALRVDRLENHVSDAAREMKSITTLSDTYAKISREEKTVRNRHQNTLDRFLRRFSNCIDEKRSGALEKAEYYDVLRDLASAVECDRAATDQTYDGEIWALSFVLDDEWDKNSFQEAEWFNRLEALDNAGVRTRRLWILDPKMEESLKKDPIEADGKELIRRVSMYCSDDNRFLNTLSRALPKSEISAEHVKLFGKGFFGICLSSGHLSLIRAVCFDHMLSSNSLGGEIDFDAERIAEIRQHWERYLAPGPPLKTYLQEIAKESPSAQEYMREAWSTQP